MKLARLSLLVVWCGYGQTPAEKQLAAAALQRASVQLQVDSIGARPSLIPVTVPPPPDAPCAALAQPVVAPLIEDAAKAQKLQPKLLHAVIETESGFRPCAVSRAGAQGLMQLMPATADELGVTDPFDTKQNIDGGARLLKRLLDKYDGDLGKALAAYNAGAGAVDQSGGIPNFPETQNYVKSILRKLAPVSADPPAIQMPQPAGEIKPLPAAFR